MINSNTFQKNNVSCPPQIARMGDITSSTLQLMSCANLGASPADKEVLQELACLCQRNCYQFLWDLNRSRIAMVCSNDISFCKDPHAHVVHGPNPIPVHSIIINNGNSCFSSTPAAPHVPSTPISIVS